MMVRLVCTVMAGVLALFVIVAIEAQAGQQKPAAPPGPGVLVGDLSAPLGVHVVSDKGIVVLLPALPDGWQVCTEVAASPSGGYGNCRSMKELRDRVKR
jgi:hypothetical protein